MPKSSKIKKAKLKKVYFHALELSKKQKGINVGRLVRRTDSRHFPYTIKETPSGAVLEYTTKLGKIIRIDVPRNSVDESTRKAFQTVVIDKIPYQATKAASRRRNSTTFPGDI